MPASDFYIDGTDVDIDNRDLRTTELRYVNNPHTFIVDTRFALELVRNALENSGQPYEEEYIKTLEARLNR